MDLDKEFALANRRIQRGIERNYLIAMARLEGMTPEDYAAKLDKERAEAAQAAFRSAMEALGANLRAICDSLVEAAEGIARGWNAAGRVP
ncbi:hypothetical protein FDJ43_gp40 [Microbacterium phage Koji]|uniref:Uncharacterized protein n=1 Tax=Microbacterium phage Koji TaxID=2099625 RepID=A0A2P1CFE1_9CAUD|nr:hypothetical protein FDJ43_gp40 [Microbacterium phage Koji]AVJ49938.1 hypothetical protein PBI_KOJI_40 [Microbacterium phage Koji]